MLNKSRIVLTVTALLALLFSPSVTHAQSADEITVRNEMVDMLNQILPDIRSGLKPSAKNIFDQISFSVPIDPAPVRVRAFRKGNSRHVEMSTGFGALTRMVSHAFIIGQNVGEPAKAVEFADYVGRTYGMGGGGDILLPGEFFGLSDARTQAILNDPQARRSELGQFQLALAFVMAHEIAHHVLGHIGNPPSGNSESRERERAADAFAAETLIRADIPPLGALLGLLYWHSVDPEAINNLAGQSHPPSVLRMRDAIRSTLTFLTSNYSSGASIGRMSVRTLVRQMQKGLVEIEVAIANKQGRDLSQPSSQCLRERTQACVSSCINKFGHSRSDCEQTYCSSQRHYAFSRLRCEGVL